MRLLNPIFKESYLNSKDLEVPRSTYQRGLNPARVRKIAANFDERIANAPKVSCRNGHYYVFDGQHTIAARVYRNDGKPLMILCKVYYGLTESDEALLFAQQFGASAILSAGVKMRALIYGGDTDAIAFLKATESVGLRLDFNQARGTKRIACIATAYNEYKKVGADIYKEALHIILEAWDGDPDSLRAETLQGVIRFVELYRNEYDQKRLVTRLRRHDPLIIYREGRVTITLTGYKRYLNQVYQIYNGSAKRAALPMKF